MDITFSIDMRGVDAVQEEQIKMLRNALASAHINILLGSAFSIERVPTLERRESWFCAVENELRKSPTDRAWVTALALLKAEYFLAVMKPLDGVGPTDQQVQLVNTLVHLVRDRGVAVAPRRLNVFTTNYDPLLELALEQRRVPFNDGFVGRDEPVFDASVFSRLQYEQSLFMEYSSQVPTVNVLKPHGSLTWRKAGDKIVYSKAGETIRTCLEGYDGLDALQALKALGDLVKSECDEAGLVRLGDVVNRLTDEESSLVNSFGNRYDQTLCLVNPSKKKFEETLLERSYYDLLRIYANELDRNNALLLVFGFSFADEHIRELTVRAAKSNPRLIVAISCYSIEDKETMASYFAGCDNVWYIVPEAGEHVTLEEFSRGLAWATRS